MAIDYSGAFGTYPLLNKKATPQYPGYPPPHSSGSYLENNPGVTAGLSGLSAYLGGLGQQNQVTQQGKLGVAEWQANDARAQGDKARGEQLARASGAAELDPLGSSQMYAGKVALIKSLLEGAKNIKSTPGDSGIASAMGSRTLPSVPQFAPGQLEGLFGDLATQGSIAQRQKQIGMINPSGPSFDLSSIYGKAEGGTQNPFDTDIESFKKDAGDDLAYNQNLSQQAVMKALEEMQKAAKGPSTLSKILGALPSLGMTALGLKG